MNWIGELYDLYDKNERFAGKMEPGQPVLLPLYHTTVAAQLTVTIDEKGNFLYAETVPEEEKSSEHSVDPDEFALYKKYL